MLIPSKYHFVSAMVATVQFQENFYQMLHESRLHARFRTSPDNFTSELHFARYAGQWRNSKSE